MKIYDLFNFSDLLKAIEDGLVSLRQHMDDEDLHILNYTPKAAYSRTWNDVTEQCRGLIYLARDDHSVLARPFRKFYNLGELDSVPSGPFTAFDKADGSLGIGYMAPDGVPAIATRGSFHSEQAEWATAFLRDDTEKLEFVRAILDKDMTPLFEIIYPENRIVLNYGDLKELVILAVIDNETGMDVENETRHWPGMHVQSWSGLELEHLADMPSENKEGFVLLWENGTRAKFKFDDYIRLHRIITGVTERTIWEMLSSRMSIEPLAEHVPDEFFQWMKNVEADLNLKFTEIEQECFSFMSDIDLSAPRREQAEKILKHQYSGILFKMLDMKPYADQIWKLVYPEVSKVEYVTE